MGTEYYVVDKAKKIFYDLGKGGWYELSYELDAFSDREYLELFILDDVYQLDFLNLVEKDNMVKYIHDRIVPDLFEHFGDSKKEDLSIINDMTDDLYIMKVKKYRCVGTRYWEKNTTTYQESFTYLNRHLEDNPINQKWYNSKEAQKYPEWKLY